MCLVGCLALFFPRLAMFLVWFFSPGYISEAISPWYWAVLGFFFMPTTSLAFAYAHNSLAPAGAVSPMGWLLVGIAVLVDVGIVGGSARRPKRKRS